MNRQITVNPLAVLADPAATLAQTMTAVNEAERTCVPSQRVKIGLSANITIDLLDLFLRKHALLNGIALEVHQGSYNDLLGDGDNFVLSGVDIWVIVPFFDNLLPFFEAQLESISPEIIDDLESDLRNRYRMAFKIGRSLRVIYVAGMHRMFPPLPTTRGDNVAATLARFYGALEEEASRFSNIRFVDLEAAISTLGSANSFDHRFYLRSKAPYTAALWNEFARRLTIMSRGFGSYFFKALVLDCDNTLWGGLIGEDFLGGIKLSPHDYPGNVFWYAQHQFANLRNNGVLLCLCSKNNLRDVDEVIQSHPDMVLRDSLFIIKKINWVDKPQNIREIANELNIGLDSIVFLDDSSFECESVQLQLPMVRTYQVPKALSDYPRLIQEIVELFLGAGRAEESRSKTEQYLMVAEAGKLRSTCETQEEYLQALGLRIELSLNLYQSIQRISELTLKTNQFNLTTRRYSEGEVRQLMESSASDVYSFVVCDKFGNHGLTGAVIMKYEKEIAFVDDFLMSCRVIGRGIEFAVWDTVLSQTAARGYPYIVAEYLPTEKNCQAADFYDRLGLTLIEKNDTMHRFSAEINRLDLLCPSWIEVTYAG